MQDEWCLIAQLDGDESQITTVASGLVEALDQVGGKLTRDGRTVRVYSDSERLAAEAERTLLDLLDETELGYEIWQERWDAERGAWEELAPDLDEEVGEDADPAQPEADSDDKPEAAFATRSGLDVRAISWQQAGFEVEAECASEEEAEALAVQVAAMGLKASARGRSVRVPAADATDAGAISDWLRASATPGAEIEVREASFVDKLRP